jgi:hypothetical protein
MKLATLPQRLGEAAAVGAAAWVVWKLATGGEHNNPLLAGYISGAAVAAGASPVLTLAAAAGVAAWNVIAVRRNYDAMERHARQLSGPWGGGYRDIDWNGVYLHNADNVLHKIEHIEAVRSGAVDWINDPAGAAKVQMYQPYLNEPIFSDVPERRWYE